MNRFRNLAAVAAVALVAGVGVTRMAEAAIAPISVGLDTVLPGGANEGGVTFGDKHYSNFNFSSTGDVTLNASAVNLNFTDTGTGQTLAFGVNLNVAGGQRADLVLGYDVSVVDPTRNIRSVGLRFDGAPKGTVTAPSAASVTETIMTLDGSALAPGGTSDTGQISVFNDGPGGLADNGAATLAINPATGLRFTKDLVLSSRAGGAGAGVTDVENSVTQNGGPTLVPLPAAVWAAMPVLGAVLAATRTRRRN